MSGKSKQAVINEIMEAMGNLATEAEAEAMFDLLIDENPAALSGNMVAGYTLDIEAVPEDEWVALIAEAVQQAHS